MENVFEQLFTGLDFKCNWSRKNCCTACTQNKFIERVIASYIKQFRYSTIYQVLSVLLNYHFVNTHRGRGGPKRHVHLSQTRPARLLSCKATGFVPSKPHNNYCYTATERFCVEAQKKKKKKKEYGVLVQPEICQTTDVDVISSTMVARAFFVCSCPRWQGMSISTRPTPIWQRRGLMSSVCRSERVCVCGQSITSKRVRVVKRLKGTYAVQI